MRLASWSGYLLLLGGFATGAGCGVEPGPRSEPHSRSEPLAIPELPTPRHGHRVHMVDGVVVVFGGYGGSGRDRGTRETMSWAPGESGWTARSPLNTGKTFFSSVVIDGAIHAIGDNVERYDLDSDHWEVLEHQQPLSHSHFAADAVGTRIYTVGGFPPERGAVTAYDTGRGTHSRAPALPGFEPGDHFHFVVTLDDRLHVLGGFTGDDINMSDQHWMLDNDGWVERARLPEPDGAKFSSWAVCDGQLYIFGMRGSHCYDPKLDRWRSVADPPETRAMPATLAHDGRLYVLGGFPSRSAHGILVYDTEDDSWTRTAQ